MVEDWPGKGKTVRRSLLVTHHLLAEFFAGTDGSQARNFLNKQKDVIEGDPLLFASHECAVLHVDLIVPLDLDRLGIDVDSV